MIPKTPSLQDPTDYQDTSKWLAKSVISLIIGLMVINVALAGSVSHVGIMLQTKEQKVQELEASIQTMRQDIASTVSLTDLANQASHLGFSSNVAYITIPASSMVALNPITTSSN